MILSVEIRNGADIPLEEHIQVMLSSDGKCAIS